MLLVLSSGVFFWTLAGALAINMDLLRVCTFDFQCRFRAIGSSLISRSLSCLYYEFKRYE